MNPTAKTSVSALESFRRFQNELLDQDELIERLTTPYQPTSDNVRIQKGNDLHRFIETGSADGMLLKWDVDSIARNLEPGDIEGEREIWISGDVGDTHIYAKADLVRGLEMRDFKATGTPFDADSYEASYQWRLYLALTGCEKFIYRVFEVSDSAPYRVLRGHTFPLYTYPAMVDDCLSLIGDFRVWAQLHPKVAAKVFPI